MTKFGIKLAENEGFKKEYKILRQIARDKEYELILFEDEEIDSEFKFYTVELLKYKELEFIGYSSNLDEVLREAEDFLMGKERNNEK